jgi:hypothetical protein
MSEQELDGSEVSAAFQEMGGEAVPQGVDSDCLPSPALRAARTHAQHTDFAVKGRPGICPGNSQCFGLTAFQYSRRTASNRGESTLGKGDITNISAGRGLR